jgi:hypothetical protein
MFNVSDVSLSPLRLIWSEDPRRRWVLHPMITSPKWTLYFLWQDSDIKAEEYAEGSLILLDTITRWRPRIVCFVGIGIWTKFESYLIEGGHVPRPRKSIGSKKSVSDSEKSKTAFAMLPYKVVHAEKMVTVGNDTNIHSGAFSCSVAVQLNSWIYFSSF